MYYRPKKLSDGNTNEANNFARFFADSTCVVMLNEHLTMKQILKELQNDSLPAFLCSSQCNFMSSLIRTLNGLVSEAQPFAYE